jgi:hypothetical protein
VLTSGALSLAVLAVVVALFALRRARALEADRDMLATHVRALGRRIAALEDASAATNRSRSAALRSVPDTGPRATPSPAAERRPRTLH